MLFNDGERLVNDGKMSVCSYTNFTIIADFIDYQVVVTVFKKTLVITLIIIDINLELEELPDGPPGISVAGVPHRAAMLPAQ